MAINPNTQYPGKIATPDANYPYGGAQNITTPSDGTGTPWEKALVNDIFGMQQALLKSGGIVPSGAADKVGASQYLQSIIELAMGRSWLFIASGSPPETIILSPGTDLEGPASLSVGMTAYFIVVGTPLGNVTVNLNGTGAKNLVHDNSGTQVGIFGLTIGDFCKIRYDGVVWRLETYHNANYINYTSSYYSGSTVGNALGQLGPLIDDAIRFDDYYMKAGTTGSLAPGAEYNVSWNHGLGVSSLVGNLVVQGNGGSTGNSDKYNGVFTMNQYSDLNGVQILGNDDVYAYPAVLYAATSTQVHMTIKNCAPVSQTLSWRLWCREFIY